MEHRWIDETQPEEARVANYFRCAGCGLIRRNPRFLVRPANYLPLYFVIEWTVFRKNHPDDLIEQDGYTVRDARPDEIEECRG